MDKTDAVNIARRYAERVRDVFDFQKIILFGSYVNGNPREDSDIDIAVIFSDYNNRLDRQFELMKLTRTVDTRIEPHPFREKDFDISNPFAKEIITYGQEIKYGTV